MEEDADVTVTYSNDGSAMNRVGNYIVQSFNINGKQRALPTLSTFGESRINLKDLEVFTLNMLSASCGGRYSEKEILGKMDFIMSSAAAHNMTVIEEVCKGPGSPHIPNSLVCNVHPLMMFQDKVKEIYQKIHNGLAVNKIKECFLVEVDLQNETFIYKAIQCITSFISKDFSAKPWNRQEHFDSFIAPKKNESLSLKDYRFNRLFD